MNEHDDDLESEVVGGGEKEADRFPDTGDELDDRVADTSEDQEENPVPDDDAAEL
jgi:hypothetical protein